jgi:hypothetical protein
VDRACQLLDQAITIYERLDATRDLARAVATLQQMGIRRSRHVKHRSAQSGWQSLTPSERAVVDLACRLTSGFDRGDVGLLFRVCGCAGLRGGWGSCWPRIGSRAA